MEDRLVELEIRIAYQERTIADLDAVVRDFAERTAKLERELAELRASVQSSPPEAGPHDDKPPHY